MQENPPPLLAFQSLQAPVTCPPTLAPAFFSASSPSTLIPLGMILPVPCGACTRRWNAPPLTIVFVRFFKVSAPRSRTYRALTLIEVIRPSIPVRNEIGLIFLAFKAGFISSPPIDSLLFELKAFFPIRLPGLCSPLRAFFLLDSKPIDPHCFFQRRDWKRARPLFRSVTQTFLFLPLR